MKKLFIIGAGGLGREVQWLVQRVNAVTPCWRMEGFIDDNSALHGTLQEGLAVVGGCDYLKKSVGDVYAVIAIASSKIKRNIAEMLKGYEHIHFATLIDPSVIKSNSVKIEEGAIICAGTILTVDIVIGKHVVLNPGCTVGHDTVIMDYVTAYPNANISGNVTIEEEAELGVGCQIIQGKRVAKQSIIGAGAVVVKNIDDTGTYVGIPAKNRKVSE